MRRRGTAPCATNSRLTAGCAAATPRAPGVGPWCRDANMRRRCRTPRARILRSVLTPPNGWAAGPCYPYCDYTTLVRDAGATVVSASMSCHGPLREDQGLGVAGTHCSRVILDVELSLHSSPTPRSRDGSERLHRPLHQQRCFRDEHARQIRVLASKAGHLPPSSPHEREVPDCADLRHERRRRRKQPLIAIGPATSPSMFMSENTVPNQYCVFSGVSG